MTLPRNQVHDNPVHVSRAASVDTSDKYSDKITWSVSVGGVSYLIEEIFSMKLETTIRLAQDYSCLLTGHHIQVNIDLLKEHLTSLASLFMREPHEIAAQETSKDFAWPAETLTRDITDLKACGSIKELIRQRQGSARVSRINGTRVKTLFKDDPQFEKLLQLAEEGVVIDLPEDFVRLTQPPPMHQLQRKLVNAFRMHALKRWKKARYSSCHTPISTPIQSAHCILATSTGQSNPRRKTVLETFLGAH